MLRHGYTIPNSAHTCPVPLMGPVCLVRAMALVSSPFDSWSPTLWCSFVNTVEIVSFPICDCFAFFRSVYHIVLFPRWYITCRILRRYQEGVPTPHGRRFLHNGQSHAVPACMPFLRGPARTPRRAQPYRHDSCVVPLSSPPGSGLSALVP